MTLHKWCSSNIPYSSEVFSFGKKSEATVKTLGVLWNNSSDDFCFKVAIAASTKPTKRDVLSQIARLFDPLGLLGPLIRKAKFFVLQKLWLLQLDWQDPLPTLTLQEWLSFIKQLSIIKFLKIPRFVLTPNYKIIALTGICDASEKGFGAVIYTQVYSKTGESSSRLLCSKSRVAPIKTLTIPRLELSACLLLEKFMRKVIQSLKMQIAEINLWSDSTIALNWIKTSPHSLKTFVANKVSKIQELSANCKWKFIRSEINSSDVLSRFLDASSLLDCQLWFNGPDVSSMLKNFDISFDENFKKPFKQEFKVDISPSLISTFTFWFVNHCRNVSKLNGALSTKEFKDAKYALINYFQGKNFPAEVKALKKSLPVQLKGPLRFLNPFLDQNGLLRVGGRLSSSDLAYDQKHHLILPKNEI
ncbi:uncharacterized protein LOC129218737 [Uloborus diversus]|uniref:uncharacterized protein LOC129218737 n=1 Tax=Uloborus diversus TaxID=327109 RepID=UPI00240A7A2B|nr:uncharacterized protein LOC129218737 [Uloborus diversus]